MRFPLLALFSLIALAPMNSSADENSHFSLSLFSTTAASHLHMADARYGQDIGTTNFSSECRTSPSYIGTDRDITCVAEIEELDLYFSEMRADLNVPGEMCTYLVHKPYFFYVNEPGKGPTQLSVTFNSSGEIVQSSPGVNPETGAPECQFDYSSQGGMNCCVGDYSLKTIRQNTAPDPDTVTVVNGQWGGSAAFCLDGVATSQDNSRNAEGFPIAQVEYLGGASLSKSYDIGSAIQSRHGLNSHRSNVYAGNFYKPSQHTGGKPKAMQFPANLPLDKGVMPQDTYEWLCMDRSQQLQARIRLFIREWNHGPIAQGGNPDVTGSSPDFPDSPINNYQDWLDFGDSYPGRNAY